MKFTTALIGLVAALATANPVSEASNDPFKELMEASQPDIEERQLNGICGGIGNPFCCGTDILGVADLQCTSPSPAPKNVNALVKTCSKSGKTAVCCTLPVGQIGLLCTSVGPN